MTAHHKRSVKRKKTQKTQREDKQKEGQPNCLSMEYRSFDRKQVWKEKSLCYAFEDVEGRKAYIPMQLRHTACCSSNFSPQFDCEERLAAWVFGLARFRSIQLNLECCERSEQVRDALLRQFHRWPETKIAQAAERCNALGQQGEQECQEQVQLYLQELRGKLVGGVKALFWLNVLQPLTHPASVPRDEVREILLALLEELKGIDGVYEQLMMKSERIWAVLTLPLKLEPLFKGVATLALCGHEVSAHEAMEMLTMFAEQYAAFLDRKQRKLPLGLSVVASIGMFAPLDISSLSDLPQTLCEDLVRPLATMVCDWIAVVEEVLDVLEKSLTTKWTVCERAPFEEELKSSMQSDLHNSFQRLSHALATDQLYAMRKECRERSTDKGCLNVTILRKRELLLVQLHREEFNLRFSPKASSGSFNFPEKRRPSMRYHLGANRKLISSNCFRLVSLVPEVQNDVEVVKPVLEELEVMRLGSSLGMLPSVNPKDFEMELLEAQEFDDDFSLFLRKEVFGTDKMCETDGVKVISLFGKQHSVKHELERLNCWSDEMTSNLKMDDQGIYCVILQNDETSGHSLVLFGWIHDGLFQKSKLRGTATYVLRFLTCLSPDIVCCLSSEDIEQLQQTVASMNSSNLDAWKSFSVAFHVERQEEQKDAVMCEILADLPLPAPTQELYLLKGSYAALALLEPAPATKRTEKSNQKFDNTIEFAKCMVNESKLHNLRVEFGATGSQNYCYQLLKVAERWPTEALQEVKGMLERSLKTTEDEVAERAKFFIENYRAKMLGIIDNLFNLDALYTASKGDIAFSTLHKYVEEIQTDPAIWSKVDHATQVTLTLPSRLKNQLKNIAATFSKHLTNSSETHEAGQALANFLKEFTVSDAKAATIGDGIFLRFGKAVGLVAHEPELLSPEFRECMADPLSEARQAWFDAVETIFVIVENTLRTKWCDETQRSYRQSCRADEQKIVTEAFNELLRTWRSQHDDELMTVVRPRRRGESIFCELEREHWQHATEQMKVFKILQSDDGTFSTVLLGAHRLHPNAKILKTFTIRTRCMVMVTTSEKVTLVERVDFPIQRPWWGHNSGSVAFTRSFGRPASLCDFNVDERVVAFVERSGRVILYRFNETFSTLEIYKRLELGLRTSLTLSVTDVLLVDGSLYVTDTNGLIQSVNLRNQQTSQAVHIVPSGSHVVNGSLVALADNVALGYVTIEDCENSSEEHGGKLNAVASEDFRGIPVEISTALPLNWCDRSIQCFGDLLFAMDAPAKKICIFRLAVTVRSESFRIQHSKEHSVDGNKHESDTDESEHWLRVFYHTYEKFPVRGLIRSIEDTRDTLKLYVACSSLLTTSNENCCRCYFQALMRDLRKLNKPLSGMDFARDLTFMTEENAGMDDVTTRPTRSFLQELITFVPIQICRAEANSLTVMTNGKATPIDTQSHDVQAVDIARSIRFGLLSPLLESWQGRCIVITSMGKQSTGKSYLLNHLTGSSFAIAGARCTDGAWMSIRILPKNVLLIVLDFEGLGSFERTEQEDVFLSVLNASISMFTIFRMEMRFDKEIDDLFARFQKGVALIKGDPRFFRGKLYMSVKDVNPNDQKGVLDEFVAKFQKLVGANKDSNFLLNLYSGQLDINCSPPLGTINYYQSLMHAQNFIENDLCDVETTGFRSGKTLNCIRLVLAKIAILDWTSLDEGAKQFQLSEVSSKLAGLIRTGCIIPQEYVSRKNDIAAYLKEDIVLAGNGKVIDVDLAAMIAEYPALGEKWNTLSEFIDFDALPDWTIDLGFDCCSTNDDAIDQVHGAIKELIRLFLRSNTRIRGGKISREIVTDFDAFLAFIVRRRKARILIWVKQMLGGRVPEEWKTIEHQFLGRFQMLLTRCQSKCDECRLGCMKAAGHPGTTHHDCGGSHICASRCEYCESGEQLRKTPPCTKEAGHEGKCECADGDHTCGQECCMAHSPNCGKKCSSKRGHMDLHKCDVVIHMCGEQCSAQKCSGRCVLNVEEPHTAHKCIEVRCMQKCAMDGCKEVCGTMDHFHGQVDAAVVFSVENDDEKNLGTFNAASEVPVVHMCGNGHECQAMCEENGICQVNVFLKQSSKIFTGARGSFQFTFQEMNGSRKKCTKLLPPEQKMHQGSHTCICEEIDDDAESENQTIHYCDVRCPCCSYFCKKKFGHFGSHTTSHGNMRNTYFLSDAEEIDIEERKYKAGELGIAEMCNLYCSKMGREHVHYLDCEQGSREKCVYSGSTTDQRRHCTRTLEPKPEKEADEVLHEQFWKTLGWEDPCTSKMELELFGKCGYKCDAPDHDDKPSYCILPAWHKPEPKPRSGFDGFTYVSGHKFECSHIASGGKMHHVFVLDCSGSMSGRPWSDLMAAWKEYIYNRIADGASMDLVSVVTFDNYAQIVYEAQNITTMTNANVEYRGGGTNYAAGLRSASEVLSRISFDAYKPAVVFFSDGHPCDPLQGEQLATHIRDCFEKNGLQAFAVGFGSINLNVLERVAEKLGGTYHHVLTGSELKATFFSISASLSTRAGLALAKPDHERNCVICAQDLASGETVKLDGCGHELHTACLNVLVRNAEQDEEPARCPSCRRTISA